MNTSERGGHRREREVDIRGREIDETRLTRPGVRQSGDVTV